MGWEGGHSTPQIRFMPRSSSSSESCRSSCPRSGRTSAALRKLKGLPYLKLAKTLSCQTGHDLAMGSRDQQVAGEAGGTGPSAPGADQTPALKPSRTRVED